MAGRGVRACLLAATLAASLTACVAPNPPAPWYGMSRPAAAQSPLRWHWAQSADDLPDADIYVLDVFTTPSATVSELHAIDRRAVCYLPVGVVAADRPDLDRFPPAQVGPDGILNWDRHDRLTPIITDEVRLCRDKGFDGVVLGELATVPRDVLSYLIEEAHRIDLPVALVDRTHPRMDYTVPAR